MVERVPLRVALRGAVTALLLLAGCAPERVDQPASPPLPVPSASSDRQDAGEGGAFNTCVQTLAVGDWSLQDRAAGDPAVFADGPRLVLCARSVQRSSLLIALGERYSLTVDGAQRLPGELSGWVVGETLDALIRGLLRGQAYTLDYRPTATGEVDRLTRVSLPASRSGSSSLETRFTPRPESRDGVDALLRERWRIDYGHLEPLLEHSDAAVRMEAIDEIAAEGAGLQILDLALAREPDPSVRIALLQKLDESGSVIALQSMLRALADTEPSVVTEALGQVADWEDAELVERFVQPLLKHDSVDVREAAKAALDRFR